MFSHQSLNKMLNINLEGDCKNKLICWGSWPFNKDTLSYLPTDHVLNAFSIGKISHFGTVIVNYFTKFWCPVSQHLQVNPELDTGFLVSGLIYSQYTRCWLIVISDHWTSTMMCQLIRQVVSPSLESDFCPGPRNKGSTDYTI